MSWEPLINNITTKANKILGFLKRNLLIKQEETKALAYKSMVMSNLEYCSTIWSPHTKKLKDKVEHTQTWAARYVTNRYHNTSSVTKFNMLEHLNWPTLEHRRNLSRLTMFYKIIHNLGSCHKPKSVFITQTKSTTRHTSPLHFQTFSTRTDYFKFSFSPYTVELWNTLPHSVVSATLNLWFRATLSSPP